jgi:hypothetical protein
MWYQELLTQSEFFDQVSVLENILFGQVIQQAATLTNQLNQRQFSAFVFALAFQVSADVVDALGKHGDLCLGATGIGIGTTKLGK